MSKKSLSFRAIRSEPISDFCILWLTGGSHHPRTGSQSVAGNFPSKTGTHLHLGSEEMEVNYRSNAAQTSGIEP